jgi:DNA polymerase Ligase (LigD)
MTTLRFVILRHEPGENSQRGLHWDLMLEVDGSLRTWALEDEPQLGGEIAAEELPRHRINYLDYEGSVTQGRGTVRRFDQGTFEFTEDSSDRVCVALHGQLLDGRLLLVRPEEDQRWIVSVLPS